MSFAFERMVAGRYLRSKRKEGFISVIAGFSFLGILLGVATLIIVMSVMNGFRAEMINGILGLNGHINVYSRSGSVQAYDPLIERIKLVPGVVSAVATVEGQALLSVDGAAAGVIVRGLKGEDFRTKPILSTSIQRSLGDGDQAFGEDRVAIGIHMAERYGLSPGDKIVLIAPKGRASPFGTIPRSRSFTVGVIFDVGMYQFDNMFIFMPLEMSQAFFQTGKGVSAIEIRTPDPAMTDQVRDMVSAEVFGEYAVSDWQDSNASLYNALEIERNVMFLILTLLIVIASFTIIACLIMLVMNKSRDIAILRTMGATRGMIIRIFVYAGTAIGVSGTLAGSAAGILFAKNIESIRRWLEGLTGTELFAGEIYFLSKLPAKMDPGQVTGIVVMALIISFAATIYPAWRAARLDPVEALRRE